MSRHRHVYGPVPSRRLGRSLGVDLLPFKTCTYDCVYCQLGHTTQHTLERSEYVPVDDVVRELAAVLATDRPDIISFAGSGEPTLHSGLGRCVASIKQMTDVPVAVFTNGSLLHLPEVRRDLARVDIVSPSLDAARPMTAQEINNPVTGYDLHTIIDGLVTFCACYSGRIWLEIMLARSINDAQPDIDALNAVLARLKNIERVQLNTVTRPPADKDVQALTREALEAVRSRLILPSEIIASFPPGEVKPAARNITTSDVLELLRCHPSTAAGLAAGLGADKNRLTELVSELLDNGLVIAESRGQETYYLSARADE